MPFGEQAALEGLLSRLSPKIAIEIGTADGGSLTRIAAHSEHVHTFDLAPRVQQDFSNVTYHCGDSRVLLPAVLRDLEGAGRSVDFVLIDGDHEAEGVRLDLLNILDSTAVSRAVIVLHDAANEGVREGIRRANPATYPKVAYVDLDFVDSVWVAAPLGEMWGGFALVVVDVGGDWWTGPRTIKGRSGVENTVSRTVARRALAPIRGARRGLAYRVRPLYRRLKRSRDAV